MSESKITDELRARIRGELPELEEISDADLRDKVVEAWAKSLSDYGFKGISELRGSGAPNFAILKKGTQTDHIRGVARLSVKIAEELSELHPEFEYNRDVLMAGALVHDVGKPLEYNAENQKRWEENPRACGWPPTRHSIQGYHVCLSVGLPLEVAHIAGAHSREGELIVRSLECTIVNQADHLYWRVLKAGGLLADTDEKWIQDPGRASR